MGKSIVVIPAHNEEKTIGQVVSEAKRYCDVLVVDDCSTDATGEEASRSGAEVLRNARNLGYTESLNAGIREAAKRSADNILLMDADGQHDPRQIPDMLRLLDSGADMVIGIRPRSARIAEWMLGVFARFTIGIHDPLCGFRAFKTSAYSGIGFYDAIGSVGTQFVFAAKKKGYAVKEMPIRLNKREDRPRFSGGHTLRAEAALFKALFKVAAYQFLGSADKP